MLRLSWRTGCTFHSQPGRTTNALASRPICVFLQTAEQKEKERRSSKRWSAAEIEQLIAGVTRVHGCVVCMAVLVIRSGANAHAI